MKRFLPFVLVAGLVGVAPAGGPITVGNNVQVSTSYANVPVREMVLAADPKNPNHLLACGTISGQRENHEWIAAFVSEDRGVSWKSTLDTKSLGDNGDPACTLSQNGVASVVTLDTSSIFQPKGLHRWGLGIYRSINGGESWITEPELPMYFQGIDNEFLFPDNTGGKYSGRLYMSGTTHVRKLDSERGIGLGIWRSTDHGASYGHVIKRESGGTKYVLGEGGGVAMSDGTLVAIFGEFNTYNWKTNDIPRSTPGHPNGILEVVTSDDGAESMSQAVKIDDYYMVYGYDFSSDSEPGIAVDSSHGPFRNRLYAVWSDVRSGHARIYISHSTDAAKTWSKAIAIDDQSMTDVAHAWNDFSPEIAVNRAGVVGVMWYDRRHFGGNGGWETRFAGSVDGGVTWTASVPVSSVPNVFRPTSFAMVGGNGSSNDEGVTMGVAANERQFNAGDYSGLAADAGGVFHPLWIDNRSGLPQIWTAQVRVDGSAQKFGDPALSDFDNVSGSLRLKLTDDVWDRVTGDVSFTATLENTSKAPIRGPLKVRITGMQSDLADSVEYDGQGIGALVDFTDAIANNILKPGQTSAPKELTFHLIGQKNLQPGPDFKSGIVQIDAQVLAHAK